MKKTDNSIIGVLRLRYSYGRFQWIVLACSGLTILTFSAQELWGNNYPSGIINTMNPPFFYIFSGILILTILLINYTDCKKVCLTKSVALGSALVAFSIDIGFLMIWETFVLLSINQVSTDILMSECAILFIILPWSLGAVSLSTLTIEYLNKQADKIQKEIEKMKEKVDSLKQGRIEGEKQLLELEAKEKELLLLLQKKRAEKVNE